MLMHCFRESSSLPKLLRYLSELPQTSENLRSDQNSLKHCLSQTASPTGVTQGNLAVILPNQDVMLWLPFANEVESTFAPCDFFLFFSFFLNFRITHFNILFLRCVICFKLWDCYLEESFLLSHCSVCLHREVSTFVLALWSGITGFRIPQTKTRFSSPDSLFLFALFLVGSKLKLSI